MPAGGRTAARGRVLLLLILAFASFLRLYHLDRQSLWLDETDGVSGARGGLLGIPARIDAPGHFAPPLDFIFLNLSLKMRENDFFARLPAAIFGSIAVYLSYLLGRILFGRRFGLALCLLMALNPAHVAYSQEARMYSLYLTLSLASSCFLLRALQEKRVRLWGGYTLCLTLTLYTHYYAFMVIAFQGIFMLLALTLCRGGRGEEWCVTGAAFRGWLLAVSAACALFLPWVPHLWLRLGQLKGTTYLQPMTQGSFRRPDWLFRFTDFLFGGWATHLPRYAFISRLVGYPLLAGGVALGGGGRRSRTIFLLCGGVIPHLILYVWVSINPGVSWDQKFLIPFIPYYLALILAGVMYLGECAGSYERLGHYLRALAFWAVLCAESLCLAFYCREYAKDNYRDIAEKFRRMALPSDAFVFYRCTLGSPFVWYYPGIRHYFILENGSAFWPEKMEEIEQHERVWLLIGFIKDDKKWAPYKGWILNKMGEDYSVTALWNCFYDVQLILYTRKGQTARVTPARRIATPAEQMADNGTR